MRSFVLGNGQSRLCVQPQELKPYGKIYGCNALYRSFSPDYLIAVDIKMVLEISKTGYQLTNPVWTNNSARLKDIEGLNYFKPSLGWSSGPTALQLACTHGADEIFILGFDYTGENNMFNNVYADTENYKRSSDHATYYGNWLRQTELVIKRNPHTKFYRLVLQNYFDPMWRFKNFKHMQYSEFRQLMNSWRQNT
jgi:hypothetical protein